MLDPYGSRNIVNNNIYLYDIFNKFIKHINGYSFLNKLTWDSYIMYSYSKNNKHNIYLGKLFIKYNLINKKFEHFYVKPEYLLFIYKLITKKNLAIKKLIFNLEIEINGYNHTNLLIINKSSKIIYIFEPFGLNLKNIKDTPLTHAKKINAIKKLFKYFKKFKIYDISVKHKLLGPQYLTKKKKITDFSTLTLNSIFKCDNFNNLIFFYHSQNENFINAITYPTKSPKIYKLHKDNDFYFVNGFDIDEGICDIYCLYFYLLLVTTNKSEEVIYTYISKNSNLTTICNLIEWIIQWFTYQIKLTLTKKFNLLIFNKKYKLFKLFKKSSKFNRLSNFDKKLSDIISNKNCINTNFKNINIWIINLLKKKYGLSDIHINQIIKFNSVKNIKCYIYLNLKNLYDLYK